MSTKMDLLNEEKIQSYFFNRHGIECKVFSEIDSTNAEVFRRLKSKSIQSRFCIIAESQYAGKGRRGRKWVSPFAKSLYFSFLWRFNGNIRLVEGLSLVIGISVAQLLINIGIDGVRVKWPNDVLIKGKKVAGILLEASSCIDSACDVVVGVGLNVYRQRDEIEAIDQLWTALDEEKELEITRTDLFIRLISIIYENINIFEQYGFSYFINIWHELDAYKSQEIMIINGDKVIFGVCNGVTNSGELLLKTGEGIMSFNCGEVSLRLIRDIGN